MNSVEKGRVVTVRAGRDSGRLMVVLYTEGEYAYLADGKLRKVERPKKKKFKHVLPQKACFATLRESIKSDNVVTDAQIKEYLRRVSEEGAKLG